MWNSDSNSTLTIITKKYIYIHITYYTLPALGLHTKKVTIQKTKLCIIKKNSKEFYNYFRSWPLPLTGKTYRGSNNQVWIHKYASYWEYIPNDQTYYSPYCTAHVSGIVKVDLINVLSIGIFVTHTMMLVNKNLLHFQLEPPNYYDGSIPVLNSNEVCHDFSDRPPLVIAELISSLWRFPQPIIYRPNT